MPDMADLDAVHLGLDENEADIAEELQDFDDSFDTRSEASESGSDSSDSQTSISSVSTEKSSKSGGKRKNTKTKVKTKAEQKAVIKTAATTKSITQNKKRSATPAERVNGKKKKQSATNDKSKKSTSEEKEAEVASNSNHSTNDANSNDEPAKKTRKKPIIETTTAAKDASGNKSDASDAEEGSTKLPAIESDSESEDSDSGANHKRNGTRKAASKSKTPERVVRSSGSKSSSSQKAYDYMTKLNYLFRDTRFFLIKSNNADNIQLSKTKSVWATLPQNDSNLNQAFKEARNVLLIFSVNESGKFAGFARMAAPSRRDIPQVAWVLPPSISSKALGGVIELDWICRKELSFNATLHLHNSWNENKPVKIGRDGQEIEPKIGAELCRLFPEDEKVELTPILRKSKETAKEMREKGIHVIYKPPARNMSSRNIGNSGGRGNGNNFGPIRHKRNYGHSGPHHRPYKFHHHHHHNHHSGMGNQSGNNYKRNSSPYRPGGNGPGNSRAGGGDGGMPSWERYMSSAAAAEAYVADYMRTMHGQLPPLPFAPPFAQMPMPPAGSSGNSAMQQNTPASIYEQLPPPVRYYDGPPPPLPDYPPPQPMRPPPPGFDKAPSYEEFTAWKNAGLPTVPPPPNFTGYGGGSSNGSGGMGGGAGAPGGGNSGASNGIAGPNPYRNRDNSGMNRVRDRRDYQSSRGGSIRGNNDRGERHHFRPSGGGDRGQRNYRDGRR